MEFGANKETIYLEFESGTKIDRIELNKLLNIIKKGDTIVVTEVSRITGSTKQLYEIIELVKRKNLKLVLEALVYCISREIDPIT